MDFSITQYIKPHTRDKRIKNGVHINIFVLQSRCKRSATMHKDATYTLRLGSKMKAALKVAAKKDRRTVSSLLEKLIADHLTKEGLTLSDEREEQAESKEL
jgi:hypothetical protein